jgi:hypothetical protein
MIIWLWKGDGPLNVFNVPYVDDECHLYSAESLRRGETFFGSLISTRLVMSYSRAFYNESVSYCSSMHFTSFQTRRRLSAEYKWHSSSTYGTLKTFRGPSINKTLYSNQSNPVNLLCFSEIIFIM